MAMHMPMRYLLHTRSACFAPHASTRALLIPCASCPPSSGNRLPGGQLQGKGTPVTRVSASASALQKQRLPVLFQSLCKATPRYLLNMARTRALLLAAALLLAGSARDVLGSRALRQLVKTPVDSAAEFSAWLPNMTVAVHTGECNPTEGEGWDSPTCSLVLNSSAPAYPVPRGGCKCFISVSTILPVPPCEQPAHTYSLLPCFEAIDEVRLRV